MEATSDSGFNCDCNKYHRKNNHKYSLDEVKNEDNNMFCIICCWLSVFGENKYALRNRKRFDTQERLNVLISWGVSPPGNKRRKTNDGAFKAGED